MRSIEPWVEVPLRGFVAESAARVCLLMTASGQVVAQHGFTRSVDVMTAAALGAGIVASTRQLASEMQAGSFGAIVHNGRKLGVYLAPFDLPRAQWIGLVVYGPDTSLGMVQLFFGRMVDELVVNAPREEPPREVLPETFEDELNASLRSLFGR
jgi:hypothetical protein